MGRWVGRRHSVAVVLDQVAVSMRFELDVDLREMVE